MNHSLVAMTQPINTQLDPKEQMQDDFVSGDSAVVEFQDSNKRLKRKHCVQEPEICRMDAMIFQLTAVVPEEHNAVETKQFQLFARPPKTDKSDSVCPMDEILNMDDMQPKKRHSSSMPTIQLDVLQSMTKDRSMSRPCTRTYSTLRISFWKDGSLSTPNDPLNIKVVANRLDKGKKSIELLIKQQINGKARATLDGDIEISESVTEVEFRLATLIDLCKSKKVKVLADEKREKTEQAIALLSLSQQSTHS
jgi:hypothetical protein